VRISVIIPTYNRRQKLERCLAALGRQTLPREQFEVIVINDGSSDETEQYLEQVAAEGALNLHYKSQLNQGQGVARNEALSMARGELVLIIGDDCYADYGLLAEHDRQHTAHPEETAAVLGFVTWLPELTPSPLMRFMEKGGAILGRWGGHQFAYDLLEGKERADARFFYTANLSLKRSLLQKESFDPTFSAYGWEDIELGMRLERKRGMVLYYAPRARVFHDHWISLEDFKKRMVAIGEGSHSMQKRDPSGRYLPSLKKWFVFRLLALSPLLFITKMFYPDLYYYSLSKKYFLKGVKKGYNKEKNEE